jgi:hypothetical protein
MAHEADHEQVDIQPVDQPDDRVDDVTRHEVRLDRHTGGCGLSFCGCDDGRKTMVGLVFLLRDFIDTRRKPRQLLDRHHVELGGDRSCQFDCCRERFQSARGAVIRCQYPGVHFTE